MNMKINIEQFIKDETKFLESTRDYLIEKIKDERAEKNTDIHTMQRQIDFVKRSANADIEYLNNEPIDYWDLYNSNFLNN